MARSTTRPDDKFYTDDFGERLNADTDTNGMDDSPADARIPEVAPNGGMDDREESDTEFYERLHGDDHLAGQAGDDRADQFLTDDDTGLEELDAADDDERMAESDRPIR